MTGYSKLVGLLGLLPTVAFAEMPKEGVYDYISCFSGTTNTSKFSDTISMVAFEQTGMIQSVVPGGPFDKETFHCVGVETFMNGKIANGTTLCESADKEGNKRMARFTNVDGKATREQLAGTGKYEGMTLTSSAIDSMGPYPTIKEGTFQNCVHQKGTYKLK
jgi:hypothetical protein